MMRLIDADALINRIVFHTDFETDIKELFEDEINAEPTIESQRKKGTWIEQNDSWDGVYYECSACGEPWTTIDGTPWDNGMNFCPHCGADMRQIGVRYESD